MYYGSHGAIEQSVDSNVSINGTRVNFLSQSKLCGQGDDVVALALPAYLPACLPAHLQSGLGPFWKGMCT